MLALIRTGLLMEDSTHNLAVTAHGQAYGAASLSAIHPPSPEGTLGASSLGSEGRSES